MFGPAVFFEIRPIQGLFGYAEGVGSMFNHEPENYICPFCLVAKGIEKANRFRRRNGEDL
jgi:hypothetical protein